MEFGGIIFDLFLAVLFWFFLIKSMIPFRCFQNNCQLFLYFICFTDRVNMSLWTKTKDLTGSFILTSGLLQMKIAFKDNFVCITLVIYSSRIGGAMLGIHRQWRILLRGQSVYAVSWCESTSQHGHHGTNGASYPTFLPHPGGQQELLGTCRWRDLNLPTVQLHLCTLVS